MIQWLLRDSPELLGDILEERASGRSRAWFWRQVLIALSCSIVDQGRRHPVLTLRAAGVSSVVYCAALSLTLFLYGFVFGYFYPWSKPEYLVLFLSVELLPALLAGWALARTHRACIEPAILIMIVLFAFLAGPLHPSELSTNIIGFAAGVWGGVRRHARPTQKRIS